MNQQVRTLVTAAQRRKPNSFHKEFCGSRSRKRTELRLWLVTGSRGCYDGVMSASSWNEMLEFKFEFLNLQSNNSTGSRGICKDLRFYTHTTRMYVMLFRLHPCRMRCFSPNTSGGTAALNRRLATYHCFTSSGTEFNR